MNDRLLHAGSIAAAAVVIGGALILVMPQHAANIIRLVIITVGAAVALYALTASVPEWNGAEWLTSPFNRASRGNPPSRASEEIDRIRARLAQRRQPTEAGPPLSPSTVNLLRPLIRVALERVGLDAREPDQMEAIRERVSPLTWTVLTTPLRDRRGWFHTRRSDETQSAEVVHHVLDDLDRLASTQGAS